MLRGMHVRPVKCLALAFVSLSVFVITVRHSAPEIDVQLGGIHATSNLPETQLVLNGSEPRTESNPYYFWTTNVPEGNIRQRLAEYFPYDPNARYNRNVIQTWYTHDDPKVQGWFESWDKVLPDFNHVLYINDGTEVEYIQSLNNTLHEVSRTYILRPPEAQNYSV